MEDEHLGIGVEEHPGHGLCEDEHLSLSEDDQPNQKPALSIGKIVTLLGFLNFQS